MDNSVTRSTNRRKAGPATSMWYSSEAESRWRCMTVIRAPLSAEVDVVGDELGLVRLDEASELFDGGLQFPERSLANLRRVDVDEWVRHHPSLSRPDQVANDCRTRLRSL